MMNKICLEFLNELIQTKYCNYCEVSSKEKTLFPCSICLSIYYCGKEHQQRAWKLKHNKICKELLLHYLCEQFFHSFNEPFLMKEWKNFSNEPSFSVPLILNTWEDYFKIFHSKIINFPIFSFEMNSQHKALFSLEEILKVCLTESLTIPLTILFCLRKFVLQKDLSLLRIHLVGTSQVEERSRKEVFEELHDLLLQKYKLEISFIGPEVSSNLNGIIESYRNQDIQLLFFRQLYQDYFNSRYGHQTPHIVFCFNSGIFSEEYKEDWKPTLSIFLNSLHVPIVFTSYDADETEKTALLFEETSYKLFMKQNNPFQSLQPKQDVLHQDKVFYNNFGIVIISALE